MCPPRDLPASQWSGGTTQRRSSHKKGLYDFSYNVHSASTTDSGNYSCVVLNGTEIDTSSASVDVTFAHIITFFPRTFDRRLYPRKDGVVYVNTGENVTIECVAEGNPVPDVFVFYNDKEVPIIKMAAGRTITGLRNITRAEGKQDNGVYSCVADNNVNPSAYSKSLDIFVYKTAVITFFDLVNDTMNSTGCRNVTAGEQQTLECKADGEPSPVVVILNDEGQEVANSSGNASYSFFVPEEMNKRAYECRAMISVLNSTVKSSLCVSLPSSSPPPLSSSFPEWAVILMAVVGSLAFIMLCIFLFYTYLKRRSRLAPTLTESETAYETTPLRDKENVALDLLCLAR